jgi:manganese/zinc/iron transport system substrate-binding protein
MIPNRSIVECMGRACAVLLLLAIIMISAGCGSGEKPADGKPADGKLVMVTTTGMIHDAVKNIVGDHAEVHALMGPGVDPHLYKATQGDLAQIGRAAIVFYNGLHLEGKMVDALEKLGRTKKVVAVAEGIDPALLRMATEFQGNPDPHIWFDVKLWTSAVRKAADELKAADPPHAADYERNAAAYIAKLDSLDAWVREQIASIPKPQRVLITAHDAFGYFGRAYDIEVRGLQGISTVSEFGLADISSLVDMIAERKIKAVFMESSVPRRSIEAVVEGVQAKGHQVTIGGELYSDAMGEAGTSEGTYIGMVSANVNKIVKALR